MTAADRVPRALRREWVAAVAVLALSTLGGAAALGPALAPTDPIGIDFGVLPRSPTVRWLAAALAVLAFEATFTYRRLDANRPERSAEAAAPTAAAYASLGLPNLVTLVRGALFAGVAGFGLLAPTPAVAWAPAILYGAGCALDAVDGFLARRRGRTTELGAKLDLAIDTTGFLLAPVVAVLWGQLPVWYLSLSAARYLFKLGRGLRRRRGKPVYDLPPSRLRRPLAGLQMAFIAFALAPVLSLSAIRPLAALVLAPSLAVFARDYLAVSGRLPRGDD
ncbi:CDP-alcohol phosphatidyltransferase family protein [Halobellus sp. EA9]|uniref:CDP-alcohol phosphatidyltransferase family protein n=1 Tax=Halobellus sp. EA9 TaxID=3421647 RepID=UPI003EBDDB05